MILKYPRVNKKFNEKDKRKLGKYHSKNTNEYILFNGYIKEINMGIRTKDGIFNLVCVGNVCIGTMNEILADHVWIRVPSYIVMSDIKFNDVIEFVGKINLYHGEGKNNNEYGITDISYIKKDLIKTVKRQMEFDYAHS